MGCKDRLGTQAGLEPLLFGEHQSGVPRKGAACGGRAASAYAVCMKKPPKVVPIEEQQYRLIAEDQKAHRIIFGIGSERMAIDQRMNLISFRDNRRGSSIIETAILIPVIILMCCGAMD